MMKVDITGLMQKPQRGWEDRVDELCRIEYVDWIPILDVKLKDALNETELSRLMPKIELVREFARYMSVGMIKGTLKYDHDNYAVEQWMAHVVGEFADQTNYVMLLFDAWAKGIYGDIDKEPKSEHER